MGVRLAQKFEALVLADSRFEIVAPRHLGMVVFRLVGENELTEALLKKLNGRGNIHCVPAALKDKYVIRFTITSQYTTIDDILKDWNEIKFVAIDILKPEYYRKSSEYEESPATTRVLLKDTRMRNPQFGTSLLLANSPMSPKIVNGSFAAIFDQNDILKEYTNTCLNMRSSAQDSPHIRRRIKGILMSGKQYSLDSHMDMFHNIDNNPAICSSSEPDTPLTVVEDVSEPEDTNNSKNKIVYRKNDECLELTVPVLQHRLKSVDQQLEEKPDF